MYDDYKFVTRKELDDLGLTHLIGSNLLRAYMHGFFLDIRLYHKVRQGGRILSVSRTCEDNIQTVSGPNVTNKTPKLN